MNKFIVMMLCLALYSVTTSAQEWLTDFEKAKSDARENNRNILLVFQGSDWCAPCMKLEREIWDSPVFQDFAKDHFVLLKADFPRKKKNRLSNTQQAVNNSLAEQFNPQGIFPLVVLMDSEANVLGKTGYKKMSPSDYIELLTSFEN